jgi:hypothetical protein
MKELKENVSYNLRINIILGVSLHLNLRHHMKAYKDFYYKFVSALRCSYHNYIDIFSNIQQQSIELQQHLQVYTVLMQLCSMLVVMCMLHHRPRMLNVSGTQ